MRSLRSVKMLVPVIDIGVSFPAGEGQRLAVNRSQRKRRFKHLKKFTRS
jgi:hypothetical protein